MYQTDIHLECLCVCARLHGVRLYCADHWCLLSLIERETTKPFVSVLPQRKERRERKSKHGMMREILSQKSLCGILSEINQKHPCTPSGFEINH